MEKRNTVLHDYISSLLLINEFFQSCLVYGTYTVKPLQNWVLEDITGLSRLPVYQVFWQYEMSVMLQ